MRSITIIPTIATRPAMVTATTAHTATATAMAPTPADTATVMARMATATVTMAPMDMVTAMAHTAATVTATVRTPTVTATAHAPEITELYGTVRLLATFAMCYATRSTSCCGSHQHGWLNLAVPAVPGVGAIMAAVV